GVRLEPVSAAPSQPHPRGACFALQVEAQAASGLSGTVYARAVVVATGYFDNPNRLGVPGEDLPWVSHYYTEAHPFYARPVVIVGGGSRPAGAALRPDRRRGRVAVVHP